MTAFVTIEGKKLKLTNLEKIMYPKSGFSKAQVIDYYRNVAEYILPHIKDRPVTLKRFPNGVNNEYFYEKQCPSHKPNWVKTLGKTEMIKNYCLINDLPSLIWIANLASLEIHTLLAKSDNLNMPTMVVFDLDPGAPATLLDCLEISLIMRNLFKDFSLKCYPKTSGGKGLHLYVPLNTNVDYNQTKNFAKIVAQTLEKFYPARVTSKMSKELRKNKVFIDWSQNVQHKTTVAVYSLRALEIPTVAMPLSWTQIEFALKSKNIQSLIYSPETAIKTLNEKGDQFSQVLTLKQQLPLMNLNKTETKNNDLDLYRQKRDFKITPEPISGKLKPKGNVFVIQKHDATRLHYDLRLEERGVLKSWAIPKGPSSNPAEKRLAVQTEDHPFEYKDFEGQIPSGQYGAGEVIIWDRGLYENISHNSKKNKISITQAIKNGTIEVNFHGQKIKGKYALVQLKKSEKKNEWLLIKIKDEHINSLPNDLEQLSKSVVSNKII